jgi:hypothetical protein
VLWCDAELLYLSMFNIESLAVHALQMLYNPQFKQQYSEELMKHYQTMIESVIDRNIREYDSHVKLFKALDSSLERGGLPNIEIAEVSCKKYCLLLILTVAHDRLC